MGLIANLRGTTYGSVCDPVLLQGDALADPPLMQLALPETLPALARSKDVLLATHGFNVPYEAGLVSLGRLEIALAMQPNELFIGVLWPGDWVIPAVNYPFENSVASHAGKVLAAFCNRWLTGARSLSLVSHSLGARVVLEAAQAFSSPTKVICVTAGAVNADCLSAEFAGAVKNSQRVVTLSSREDLVLALAYPVGDFIGDILDDDHRQFELALGREGPVPPIGPSTLPWQIPDADGYDHGDYLPPGDLAQPAPNPGAKWTESVGFIARAFREGTQTWP